MENVMRVLADDIALGLLKEWQQRKAVPVPPALRARDTSVDQIAQESVTQQENVQTSTISEREILLRRLQQVESALEKLATRINSGQGQSEVGSDLGGEGSKYQNVETMLKYVDSTGAEGGVKLVIMNFND